MFIPNQNIYTKRYVRRYVLLSTPGIAAPEVPFILSSEQHGSGEPSNYNIAY